jgi:signal transduction histidine kinase
LGTVTARYGGILSEDAVISPSSIGDELAMFSDRLPAGYLPFPQGHFLHFCEITPTLVATSMTILICAIADVHSEIARLHVFKPSSEMFNESEIRLVQQVANQSAIAIRQARLYQKSQHQVQELKQLHDLKDIFLSTVSHELRTPLSNMSMAIRMVELIIQQPDQFTDPQSRLAGYLNILKTQCQQETTLINDLLELSRLDATVDLVLTSLNLNSWLPEIIAPFEDRIRSQQQRLQVTIPADLPPLMTDASIFQRSLTELLNNACKYTPSQETISITAISTGEALQLIIRNSGVELPQDQLDRIFERFYRVPTSNPWQQGGTGLGLALVQNQVKHLGGKIAVSNRQGWMTFALQLPWTHPKVIS